MSSLCPGVLPYPTFWDKGVTAISRETIEKLSTNLLQTAEIGPSLEVVGIIGLSVLVALSWSQNFYDCPGLFTG